MTPKLKYDWQGVSHAKHGCRIDQAEGAAGAKALRQEKLGRWRSRKEAGVAGVQWVLGGGKLKVAEACHCSCGGRVSGGPWS